MNRAGYHYLTKYSVDLLGGWGKKDLLSLSLAELVEQKECSVGLLVFLSLPPSDISCSFLPCSLPQEGWPLCIAWSRFLCPLVSGWVGSVRDADRRREVLVQVTVVFCSPCSYQPLLYCLISSGSGNTFSSLCPSSLWVIMESHCLTLIVFCSPVYTPLTVWLCLIKLCCCCFWHLFPKMIQLDRVFLPESFSLDRLVFISVWLLSKLQMITPKGIWSMFWENKSMYKLSNSHISNNHKLFPLILIPLSTWPL